MPNPTKQNNNSLSSGVSFHAGSFSQSVIASPLGALGLLFRAGKLIQLDYLFQASPSQTLTPEALKIQTEIEAYFKNPQYVFNESLFEPLGTDFQIRVWQALLCIPAGKPCSYQTLALALKTHPRAIGNACRKNPLPLIIPCHRVLAKNHLGGYAGQTQGDLFNIKTRLLQHEGINLDEPRDAFQL